VAARHRSGAAGGVAVLAVAWIATALLGTQLVPGVPVAARSQADLVRTRTLAVRASLHDQKAFAAAVTRDQFRTTPGNQLLTALRGKDVVVSFVESYGRSALEDPQQAAIVGPALAAGERQLAAAGFTARSGFLTSSTFGGYSWLAHATLQSGLLINGQQRLPRPGRHRPAHASPARSGGQAGATVAVEPDNTYAWPEGRLLRLSAGVRLAQSRVRRAAVRVVPDAGPVHAGGVPAARVRQAARSDDGRGDAHVQSHAVGAASAAGGLEGHRRRFRRLRSAGPGG
jgi:hypothetical protein